MDRRDRMNGRERQDHAAAIARGYLIVTFEDDDGNEIEGKLPCEAAVCGTCNGKGTHVNPSIDAHGITSEEFGEWDEDEVRGYFNGRYDVTCYECSGNKVVAEPIDDERRLTPDQRELLVKLQEREADRADYERECEAERRFGC